MWLPHWIVQASLTNNAMSHCSKTRNYKLVNQDEEARNPTIYICAWCVCIKNKFSKPGDKKGIYNKDFC